MTEPTLTVEADNLGVILLAQREAKGRAFANYMRALSVYTAHTGHNAPPREAHLARLGAGDDDRTE